MPIKGGSDAALLRCMSPLFGPNRQFAAMQQDVGNGGQTGRSSNVASTVVPERTLAARCHRKVGTRHVTHADFVFDARFASRTQ